MPLHPQVAHVLDLMARSGGKPLEELTIAEARAGAWGWLDYLGDPEPVARVTDRFIPGPTADLPIRIYRPAGDPPFPAIVAFHGSGWVISNIDLADPPHRALANRTGCIVVAVNYQKAPEHKFPIPLDDAYAATVWVAEHAEELEIHPGAIGVSGESAGGNLAAAVCLRARDAGGPPIAWQLLISPVTDYRFDYPSMTDNAEGYLLTTSAVRWFWSHYLRGPEDTTDPLAVPMRASDLAGLPPAIIVTAEFDPLRDEAEAYADRLAKAGVPTIKRRYDGMVHAFVLMGRYVDASATLLDDLGRDVRDLLAGMQENRARG